MNLMIARLGIARLAYDCAKEGNLDDAGILLEIADKLTTEIAERQRDAREMEIREMLEPEMDCSGGES